MARVTVEDCVDKVENRFDLVLLAAHRARNISSGSELTIDRDRDKNPVVALREIAEETIRPADLRESMVVEITSKAAQKSGAISRLAALRPATKKGGSPAALFCVV